VTFRREEVAATMRKTGLDSKQIQRMRRELIWLAFDANPNKCSCRDARCCQELGHALRECPRVPTVKLWKLRWEYYCEECSNHEWSGSKVIPRTDGNMVA
jgi:hypothetical protein